MSRKAFASWRLWPSARPALEALEARVALACQATFAQPLLRVTCDGAADYVELRTEDRRILFNGQPIPGSPTVDNTVRIDVNAGAGDDWVDLIQLSEYRGTTTLLGGAGDDVVLGSEVGDFIQGNDGIDFVWGYDRNDTIEGNRGTDFLMGWEGNDVIYVHDQSRSCADLFTVEYGWGEGGDDTLVGDLCGLTEDYLDGGVGNDLILGLGLTDTLLGGPDNDTVYGGDGNDYVYGGEGQDALYGDQGDDYLLGEAGSDSLDGGAGADYMDGGDGIDYSRQDIYDWVVNCELPW